MKTHLCCWNGELGLETVMADITAASALRTELETYQRLVPTLLQSEGRFALIAGEDLLGIFDTYSDALAEGYRSRGLSPFLVKRISSVEAISFFSRDLRPTCPISQTA